MTVLQALAILEAATLQCKKRDINTPEVKDALDLLEPHIRPEVVDSQSPDRRMTTFVNAGSLLGRPEKVT